MGRNTTLVGRPDRRHRRLVCRRGVRFPRQLRPSGGTRHRALIGDALPYDAEFTPASFSPCQYAHRIESDVAVLSVSGWMDGTGYQNGAIARFLTLPNRNKHLLLGPGSRARINVSPWRPRRDSRIFARRRALRFFDTYLMELDTVLSRERQVHYFCMHAEAWREAALWPPVEMTRRLFLSEGGALSTSPGAGEDCFTVHFGFGTGTHTRYGRLAAHDIRTYYDDWQPREATLPCYRSEPLDTAVELVGHCGAEAVFGSLRAGCSAALYLSEEEPDGTVHYATEGVLRALHPKLSAGPPNYRSVQKPSQNRLHQ
jgi:putative CocE/NonD family hydrolase